MQMTKGRGTGVWRVKDEPLPESEGRGGYWPTRCVALDSTTGRRCVGETTMPATDGLCLRCYLAERRAGHKLPRWVHPSRTYVNPFGEQVVIQ